MARHLLPDGSMGVAIVRCAHCGKPVLTPRQVEVLEMLAHGASNAQIAEELSISQKTATNLVCEVYRRIGVTSERQASYYYWSEIAHVSKRRTA